MIKFSEIQRRITERFSVEELEARLRPQRAGSREDVWSDHSQGGFLAPHERLLDVVRADYDTLCALGKSYEEMAQGAAHVLEQQRRGTLYIDRFTLLKSVGAGSQSCPWECTGKDAFGYDTNGSGHINVFEMGADISLANRWGEVHDAMLKRYDQSDDHSREERRNQMREFERSIGVDFGGLDRAKYLCGFTVITDLTPHLIASHYFFQGDASYRTDPRRLLEVVGMT